MNKVLDKKDAVFVKRNDPELNYGQTGTFVQIDNHYMFQPHGPVYTYETNGYLYVSEGVFDIERADVYVPAEDDPRP